MRPAAFLSLIPGASALTLLQSTASWINVSTSHYHLLARSLPFFCSPKTTSARILSNNCLCSDLLRSKPKKSAAFDNPGGGIHLSVHHSSKKQSGVRGTSGK